MVNEYGLNDIVEMKKEHPCHKSKYWHGRGYKN